MDFYCFPVQLFAVTVPGLFKRNLKGPLREDQVLSNLIFILVEIPRIEDFFHLISQYNTFGQLNTSRHFVPLSVITRRHVRAISMTTECDKRRVVLMKRGRIINSPQKCGLNFYIPTNIRDCVK